MYNGTQLVLDTFCEVYDLLKPWADGEFWDFASHEVVSGAVYLIGRKQFIDNIEKIKHIVRTQQARVILSNPFEGSETLAGQCRKYGVESLVKDKKILLIGGGDMDPSWPCLPYDSFIPKVFQFDENKQAVTRSEEIFSQQHKPYKFAFLNGRMRVHRKYLIEYFDLHGLLEHSIWSILDRNACRSSSIRLDHLGQNLINASRPVKTLDACYEVDFYKDRVDLTSEPLDPFVKNWLFKHEWGEIYLNPELYIDTYFSVVTETVFEYPWSFRTEKIWKPIAMGHPFIVAANAGYYRDLRNLGFQTFGHVIDESFDTIDDNQKRIERIAHVVKDLCQQDLANFLEQCYNTCKYNQQHFDEMSAKVRTQFPDRFFHFISQYQ